MLKRSVRVLALVPYPPGMAPSQRFRVEQWIPGLKQLGIECDLSPFLDEETYRCLAVRGRWPRKAPGLLRATMRRLRILRSAARYDLVLVHREAMTFGPAVLERLLARRKPIVFDFDDSIWLRNENPVNPLAGLVKCPGKVRAIVARAGAILAGNSYLAAWARRYGRSVHVVPTTIDTEGTYGRQKVHGPSEVPVVGWSGTASTFRYLEFLRPALAELARRRRFRFLGIYDGPARRWPGIDAEWRTWRAAREVEDLMPLDVGLMPQPEEEWARGKCGCKALQYMALGIPPVASRNGVLPEIIEDGRSGFLAGAHEEWVERLTELLDDWKLRAAIGEQGRSTVKERYSAHVHVPRIAEIMRAAGTDGS
jgi:glycosyltransferase involved in cell wall biosynthesis